MNYQEDLDKKLSFSQTSEEDSDLKSVNDDIKIWYERGSSKRIRIGICCMDKKAYSKPMLIIIKSLIEIANFQVINFTESSILYKNIYEWPICDVLITFFSSGFPSQKVEDYIKLRRPFNINNLKTQYWLWDRKLIYKILMKYDIPIAEHFFVTRNKEEKNLNEIKSEELYEKYAINLNDLYKKNSGLSLSKENSKNSRFFKNKFSNIENGNKIMDQYLNEKQIKEYDEVIDEDNFIIINGHKLKKPVVEKPYDAENHDIRIYYPIKKGGGCKLLFRKVNNKASDFDKNINTVRKEGNYIYESFLLNDGFDIKVYAIGLDYFYAEARKSPTLDGIVHRNKDGQELRFPVNLSSFEKNICRKIIVAFDQVVCGFDIIRSKNRSYVCDVNGWSFVKGNESFNKDLAYILSRMIMTKFMPKSIKYLKKENSLNKAQKFHDFRPGKNNNLEVKHEEELRSVIGIFRHADRTPKQKMKMKVNDINILNLFIEQKNIKKEIKFKSAKNLNLVLNIVKNIILNYEKKSFDEINKEYLTKLKQIVIILENNGHFQGINRKIQIQPLTFEGTEENKNIKVIECLFILKWGGEITHSGITQANRLAKFFKNEMFNQIEGGLDRLHTTYRHDLKSYAADEGRCIITAASFVRSLLNLEGDLTPILGAFVRNDELAESLLDFTKEMKKEKGVSKKGNIMLNDILDTNDNILEKLKILNNKEFLDDDFYNYFSKLDNCIIKMKKVEDFIKYILENLEKNFNVNSKHYYLTSSDKKQIRSKSYNSNNCLEFKFCNNENLILFYKRWKKLENDFFNKKNNKYDVSKIPDIYDNIKYDMTHNMNILKLIKLNIKQFNDIIIELTSFVVPGEYGITINQKLNISKQIIKPLFLKIITDLKWWNEYDKKIEREIDYDEICYMSKGLNEKKLKDKEINSVWRLMRTRLYFTCASHIYAMFNVLIFSKNYSLIKDDNIKIQLKQMILLDYLSYFTFRFYEDLNVEKVNKNRFRIELYISPGSDNSIENIDEINHLRPLRNPVLLNDKIRLDDIVEFYNIELNN